MHERIDQQLTVPKEESQPSRERCDPNAPEPLRSWRLMFFAPQLPSSVVFHFRLSGEPDCTGCGSRNGFYTRWACCLSDTTIMSRWCMRRISGIRSMRSDRYGAWI